MHLRFNLGKTFLNASRTKKLEIIETPTGILLLSEAWKMYMTDQGLGPTINGGVTKDQYMRYRERIEFMQPLSAELEYLQMGFLPPK